MKMKKMLAMVLAVSMCAMMIGCSEEPAPAADANTEEEVVTETEEIATDEDVAIEEETAEEEAAAEEEVMSNLCLTGGEYLFKDYTYITNEYNEDGSYYDEYVSEDGVQAVYEKGVKDYNTDIAVEDYMLEEATKLAGDAGVMNATLEESTYETELSYPAYVAKFYSGSNEDTRSWIVYVVDTDSGLYMYGLSCAADYEEDMFYDADDVFPKLTIEENYRALAVNDIELSDVTDLIDFLGNPIEDALPKISGLVQDGEQYSSKEETSVDGISLAGPFIDVDADSNVTCITYGGTQYSVDTVWVGTSMTESGQILKDNGWEFSGVDFAHGTAQYVVTYNKDNMELSMVSDESGDFDKSEESDVTGCISVISVYYKL